MPGWNVRSGGGAAAVVLAAGLLAGCGDSDPARKEVHPVVGRVLVNGRPEKGIDLTFFAEADLDNPRSLKSMATTAEDGSFRVTTYGPGDGSPEGAFRVIAYWAGPLPPNASPTERGPDRLKGRYHNPWTTPLRVTIQPGQNDIPVMELKTQ